MIPRQEFVAMTALSYAQQGKKPDEAAEMAEALAINLEKRNIRMWKKEGEETIIMEDFLSMNPVRLVDLADWAARRYQDPAHPGAAITLKPGAYRITVSAIDKTRIMP